MDPKAKGRRSGVKKTGDAEDEDSETYPESDDEDSERSGSGGLSAIYEPVFRMLAEPNRLTSNMHILYSLR